MEKNHRKQGIIPILFITLFINLVVADSLQAQTEDTTKIPQIQPADSTKNNASPAKTFSEIAQYLVKEQQVLSLSYTDTKIEYRIEKEAKLFQVPGGESRVALFALPDYVNDYILTIKSKMHGLGYTYRIFAPSCVFLDSSFRPIHFLGEKNFLLMYPSSFKKIHLKTEVAIDNDRKDHKYLLIYTSNKKNDRIGTFSLNANQGLLVAMLKHPVERSPDGRLQLELHLR
jgi:Maltose operon periplasmic protein precursor (MalM)